MVEYKHTTIMKVVRDGNMESAECFSLNIIKKEQHVKLSYLQYEFYISVHLSDLSTNSNVFILKTVVRSSADRWWRRRSADNDGRQIRNFQIRQMSQKVNRMSDA